MAHYALHKLHILPNQLAKMSIREKAFIFASIELRLASQKRIR